MIGLVFLSLWKQRVRWVWEDTTPSSKPIWKHVVTGGVGREGTGQDTVSFLQGRYVVSDEQGTDYGRGICVGGWGQLWTYTEFEDYMGPLDEEVRFSTRCNLWKWYPWGEFLTWRNFFKGKEKILIFFRRHTNVQQVYENIFSINNHQGNINQNYDEILSHMC